MLIFKSIANQKDCFIKSAIGIASSIVSIVDTIYLPLFTTQTLIKSVHTSLLPSLSPSSPPIS
jgi:hypothetical protein